MKNVKCLLFTSVLSLSSFVQSNSVMTDVTSYPFQNIRFTNEQSRSSWDTLSKYHPANHRPDDFIYIITEIEAPVINAFTLPIIKSSQMISENMRICTSVVGSYATGMRKKKREFYGTFRGQIA